MERVFGVHLLLLDHSDDFVEQRAVFQHQQVGVEYAAFLGSHGFADLPLNLQNLLAG